MVVARRQNRQLPQVAGVAEHYDRVRFELPLLDHEFALALAQLQPDDLQVPTRGPVRMTCGAVF
jgi:hypothetical protein